MPRKKRKTPEEIILGSQEETAASPLRRPATDSIIEEGIRHFETDDQLAAKLRAFLNECANDPAHGSKLCGKSREIVRKVHLWFSGLSHILGNVFPDLKDAIKLTTAATGVGHKGLKSTLSEPKESNDHSYAVTSPVSRQLPPCSFKPKVPQTPEAKSQRLLAGIPAALRTMMTERIRVLIHFLYRKKGRLVLSELNELFREELAEFQYDMSRTSLWRLLKALGFTYRVVSNRCIIYEKPELVKLRHTYLKRIKEYRGQNAFLGFSDETWVFEGMRSRYNWVDDRALDDPTYYLKQGLKLGPDPSATRGKRAIVIGTITEEGILDGSFKVWTNCGGVEDGDYHKTMDFALFKQYLHDICPRLVAAAKGRKPVLVLNNAAYHNQQAEKLPTSSSRKADLKTFLTRHGVPIFGCDSRTDLFRLVQDFYVSNGGRDSLKRFCADEIAQTYGVTILRLPPYHCQLNPIEHFWGYMKGQITKNASGKEKLEELKLGALEIVRDMPHAMKSSFFNNAEHVEDEFIKKEGLVFVSPVPFIIDIDDINADSVDSDSDDNGVSLDIWGFESEGEEIEFEEDGEKEAVRSLWATSPFGKALRRRRT